MHNGGRTEENRRKGKKNMRDKTRAKQVRKGVKYKRKNRKLREEKGIRKKKTESEQECDSGHVPPISCSLLSL